MYNNLRLRKV